MTPKEEQLQKSMCEIATEAWRLKKSFERVLNLLDIKEKQKMKARMNL